MSELTDLIQEEAIEQKGQPAIMHPRSGIGSKAKKVGVVSIAALGVLAMAGPAGATEGETTGSCSTTPIANSETSVALAAAQRVLLKAEKQLEEAQIKSSAALTSLQEAEDAEATQSATAEAATILVTARAAEVKALRTKIASTEEKRTEVAAAALTAKEAEVAAIATAEKATAATKLSVEKVVAAQKSIEVAQKELITQEVINAEAQDLVRNLSTKESLMAMTSAEAAIAFTGRTLARVSFEADSRALQLSLAGDDLAIATAALDTAKQAKGLAVLAAAQAELLAEEEASGGKSTPALEAAQSNLAETETLAEVVAAVTALADAEAANLSAVGIRDEAEALALNAADAFETAKLAAAKATRSLEVATAEAEKSGDVAALAEAETLAAAANGTLKLATAIKTAANEVYSVAELEFSKTSLAEQDSESAKALAIKIAAASATEVDTILVSLDEAKVSLLGAQALEAVAKEDAVEAASAATISEASLDEAAASLAVAIKALDEAKTALLSAEVKVASLDGVVATKTLRAALVEGEPQVKGVAVESLDGTINVAKDGIGEVVLVSEVEDFSNTVSFEVDEAHGSLTFQKDVDGSCQLIFTPCEGWEGTTEVALTRITEAGTTTGIITFIVGDGVNDVELVETETEVTETDLVETEAEITETDLVDTEVVDAGSEAETEVVETASVDLGEAPDELAFTGTESLPVGAMGLAMVIGGVVTVILPRRRLTD